MLASAPRTPASRGVLNRSRVATLSPGMASRKEEKERLRREREERERAAKLTAARRRRLQFAFGGVLAVLIVAAVGVVAAGALGGGTKGGTGQPASVKSSASIPAAQEADLTKAAAAAGCKLVNAPIEGNTHLTKNFTEADYKTNPPTSGNHNPIWYQDGIYLPGDTPRLGQIVHPLEHGRIEVQYKPGTPSHTVAQLETLYNQESGGYHMLLFQNTTNMPFQVAAAAWGHYVGCPAMNDKVFDAIRDFRTAYINKGPETVP
jgi:hypothetical protein